MPIAANHNCGSTWSIYKILFLGVFLADWPSCKAKRTAKQISGYTVYHLRENIF